MAETVTKPEWVYRSEIGNCTFSVSVIRKQILYGISSGYIHQADVIHAERMMHQVLDDYFSSNAPFYFVSDLTDVTGSSMSARNEHLHHRLKQLEQARLLIYVAPNALLRVAIKAGRLFSSQLREKVVIADNYDHVLSIVERHEALVSAGAGKREKTESVKSFTDESMSTSPEQIRPDLPDSKEALKALVVRLHEEKAELKALIRERSDQLIRIMNEITWGDAVAIDSVDIGQVDDFTDLFTALKLLQEDLYEFRETQKKNQAKLAAREKQYKTVFNNIADIVLLHDAKTHRFVGFNDRALKYGYSQKELLSMTPYDLHPPEELARVEEEIDDVNDDPGTGNMWHHRKKDGSLVDVEIMTSEIEYNGKPTFVSIVRDITDRRRFEKALIKRQQEAEAASRSKSDFLANMSHEIRTPMNGVIGMLDILSETDLAEEQRQFVQTAQQSADSLLVIINDILDFSKIEAGKIEIETIDFDLTVTLDSISDLMGIKTFEKGVTFACLIENDVPVLLRGDPSRLRQILTNLTGNALKFTEKGEIFTRISVEDQDAGTVTLRFEVSDTGVGIPPDKLETLFESFTQVDASTTRKYGGTGLGLAISKQLCELMGGRIGVKSKLGRGSVFYFSAVFQKQSEPAHHFYLNGEVAGRKILIVDDNRTNQNVFKEYLKSWGAVFDIAGSGEQALLKLKEQSGTAPYDIALIDMQMPGMSGLTLGKRIKSNPAIKKTVLIMLSSIADRGDTKDLLSAGFAGYLTKPVKKKKLFDTLQTVLSMNESGDAGSAVITSYRVEEIQKAQSVLKKSLSILLVEDNKINQKVAQKMLEPMAKKITLADDGKKAVDCFKSDTFDVIFMDVQMPVMDGKEAIRKIREDESKSSRTRTPVIALTANAMKGDRESLIECGADEYLAKPVKKKDLIKVLETIGLI